MGKVTNRAEALYEIQEIMTDHSLTAEQALFLLCGIENIEWESTARDLVSLYNKGLIVKGKVNQTLLFHLKTPVQQTLALDIKTEAIGTDYTKKIVNALEKEFVLDKFLTDEERKSVADKYFKGDTEVARHFIIFRSLFPMRDKKRNAKWNKKFGFVYDGISLWDPSLNVAKKFHQIYRKKDMGIFLEATYRKVKDSTKAEDEACFMTKPYKFLVAFDDYYDITKDAIEDRQAKAEKRNETGNKQNKLNV